MEMAAGLYYVPHGTRWPIFGSVGLFTLMSGGALWLNQVGAGSWIAGLGFLLVIGMLVGWFGTVIGESEQGLYNAKVDSSFRWGMSWFIFSEVMFFAVFFGALFYARQLTVPGSPVKATTSLRTSCCGRVSRTHGRRRARPESPSNGWELGVCLR
jgi:cytochrome c oxidase subunit 3